MISYDYLEAALVPLVNNQQLDRATAQAIMAMRRQLHCKEQEMDNVKPGYMTTELWLTAVNSIIGVLIAYGILSQPEATAWEAVAAAIVPLALSIAAAGYAYSRAKVKASAK